MKYELLPVRIADIRPGDTVEHNGKLMTVCAKDISRDAFLGPMIFGDSYSMGRRAVMRAEIYKAMP